MDLLNKIDPLLAIMLLANGGQWWAYRKDLASRDKAISDLAASVRDLLSHIKGGQK